MGFSESLASAAPIANPMPAAQKASDDTTRHLVSGCPRTYHFHTPSTWIDASGAVRRRVFSLHGRQQVWEAMSDAQASDCLRQGERGGAGIGAWTRLQPGGGDCR